jgi:carbohydrate diacid regulator
MTIGEKTAMTSEVKASHCAPPVLSKGLYARLIALSGDISNQSERMTAAVCSEVEDYQRAEDDDDLRCDIYSTIKNNLRLWYQAILSPNSPALESLGRTVASAQRRFHQNVSLDGLQSSYRIAYREYWSILLAAMATANEFHEELLFKVSPYLFYHCDVVSTAVAKAYTIEQSKRVRARDCLQHTLCTIVLEHPERVESFNENAVSLGIDPLALHTAIAISFAPQQGIESNSDNRLEPLLAAISRTFKLQARPFLYEARHHELVAWLPQTGPTNLLGQDCWICERSKVLKEGAPGVKAIGVGLPGLGPKGWHASAKQALKTLSYGRVAAKPSVVFRYSDFMLDDAAMKSEEIIRFLDSILERLSSEPDLLESLKVYFNADQQRKRAASELGIHPNTLDHRLRRIETMFGYSLSRMHCVRKLHSALQLRELRGA